VENKLTFNKETHEYFFNGAKLPSVTHILQDAGIIDLSGIPFSRLEAAREFGSAVHLACQLYDEDNLNEKTLDHNLRPYLDAWVKFEKDTGFEIIEFEEDTGFVIIENENPICSPKYRFAGTPDRVGRLDCLTIVDIKSTAELSPAIGIQTAGYQIAWNETHEEKVKKRIAVLLQPDGKYKIESYKDKNDTNVFLAALSVFNWKKRNLK
jgi:hypothetical protein